MSAWVELEETVWIVSREIVKTALELVIVRTALEEIVKTVPEEIVRIVLEEPALRFAQPQKIVKMVCWKEIAM